MPPARRPIKDRLLERIEVVGECWIYRGTLAKNGYGTIGKGGGEKGTDYAHRVSYRVHVGEIPPGMSVCHTCDVRPCVNPAHLFVDTQQGNMDDAKSKRRTSYGERRWNARLKEDDIRAIRRLHREGRSMSDIAREYSVTRSCIQNVVHRRRWNHVEDEPETAA